MRTVESLYRSVDELDFTLEELKSVALPGRVLVTSPEFYDIQYVINRHMTDHVGGVDYARAFSEWHGLKEAYERIGIQVHVIEGKPGLPDMVFCANQTLPFYRPDDNRKGVILSEMHAKERRREVDYFKEYFVARGYEALSLSGDVSVTFEGMGDALWHSGRYLLWGGFGFRTTAEAYSEISDTLGLPICLLELRDPDFYHLDTCLSILDESTALICTSAFQPEGLALIRSLFSRVLEAPEKEARSGFACNAHCPDRRHVLIQEGCDETKKMLIQADFVPIELDTSEYMKSGGSVFCMKQMFW